MDPQTREQFIQEYCESHNITREELLKKDDVLPCTCRSPECRGWAAVPKNGGARACFQMMQQNEGETK